MNIVKEYQHFTPFNDARSNFIRLFDDLYGELESSESAKESAVYDYGITKFKRLEHEFRSLYTLGESIEVTSIKKVTWHPLVFWSAHCVQKRILKSLEEYGKSIITLRTDCYYLVFDFHDDIAAVQFKLAHL
jgi:hypothetical protein